MNYSGPSQAALLERDLEAERLYEEAREEWEYLLENLDRAIVAKEVDEWVGSNWTDHVPMIQALIEGKDAGSEQCKAILNMMGHDYARSRT